MIKFLLELPVKIYKKIKWILRNRQQGPGMDEKRKIIEHFISIYKPRVFIETGTFMGDTVEYFRPFFNKIYSIELSVNLANQAVKRFENVPNVTILQGDSGEILGELASVLNEPALFWLDGHYSSEFFYGGKHIITAKGTKETPVEMELSILLSLPANQLHVIMVDDARLFNGMNDYPTLKSLKEKVKSSGLNYRLFVSNDIIHIIPNQQ